MHTFLAPPAHPRFGPLGRPRFPHHKPCRWTYFPPHLITLVFLPLSLARPPDWPPDFACSGHRFRAIIPPHELPRSHRKFVRRSLRVRYAVVAVAFAGNQWKDAVRRG